MLKWCLSNTAKKVLILTYWNVNWWIERGTEPHSICFNLNLLECKFYMCVA